MVKTEDKNETRRTKTENRIRLKVKDKSMTGRTRKSVKMN